MSGPRALALALLTSAFVAPEIRQVIPLTNAGFDTDLRGWSKTSSTRWTHAPDPAGVHGGTVRYSKTGSAADHSIWQDYDLPGSALTAPAATRIGQKLELGGWVYVSSNFDGRFYLEINSIDSRGAKTNIARTNPSVDATAASGEVPRNRWIYITTEPASGQDSRVLPSTRRISVAFAVHDATGDIYFDRAALGLFGRGARALGDASFELTGSGPSPWNTSSNTILRRELGGYYGKQHGEFLAPAGTSRLHQSVTISGASSAPHYRERVEVGAWVRVPATTALTRLKLSVYPAGTGIGTVAPIAATTISGSSLSPGVWTYVETSPAAQPRVPFRSGTSTVSSLRIELEANATAATEIWVDFVQAGQLHGVTGNPRKFVIADYNPYWRAPLRTDADYTGWTSRDQWRNWNSMIFRLHPSCGTCDLRHDPENFRANGRRDAATTVDNGTLDELPLVGAYHTLADGLMEDYQVPLMQAARIDAVAVEYYGPALAEAVTRGVEDPNGNGKADDRCFDPRGPHFQCTLERLFDVADATDLKVFPHFVLPAHVGANYLRHADAAAQKHGIEQDLVTMVNLFYARKACLKIDGKMVVAVFGARPRLLDGSSLADADWSSFLDAVRAATGKEVALLDTRMQAQSNYTLGTYLPSFIAVTTWHPYSAASPFDLRKYSSVCAGTLRTPPAPALGDAYAASLAERAQQWMAFDDENRLGIGFVYADFDDSAVSGWGQSHCMRILAESLDMSASTWRAVTDGAFDWAFIASWNDWSESHRIEPAWRQSFHDAVFAPDYDPGAVDQRRFFDAATIDWCFGRLMDMEAGIAALKGQAAPGSTDTDDLLRIAGTYLRRGWHGARALER